MSNSSDLTPATAGGGAAARLPLAGARDGSAADACATPARRAPDYALLGATLAFWCVVAVAGAVLIQVLFHLTPAYWAANIGYVNAALGLYASWVLHQFYAWWFRSARRAGRSGIAVERVALMCLVVGMSWAIIALAMLRSLETGGILAGRFTVEAGLSLGRVREHAFLLLAALDVTLLAAYSGIYVALRVRREVRLATERALRAQALADAARYEALRYQLNPHFLFNALNAVQSLMAEDVPRAQRMVGELAGFLRHTLQPDATDDGRGTALVPLREELAALRSYLAVEHARFEERLDVTFAIEAAAEAMPLPALLLQPLVENAVKHGMATSAMPLRLRVSATVLAGVLRLEVANTGRWASGVPGNGVGVRNVRERLALAYPGRHEFTVTEREGWVLVQVAVAPAAA